MNVKAQVAMVMHLDKCVGCHTCSVTCKNTWTNRPGTEYIWFNDVETKPGVGYPKKWEDQERYRGGWTLRHGRLTLKAGPPASKLAHIFYNPDLPALDDYYEPWTYDYDSLLHSPLSEHQPVARPISSITGEYWDAPQWGPNWDDDLAGGPTIAAQDPDLTHLQEHIKMEFESTFMMYLPRICEHCLNPSCVASCPSGALYKRDEDGIVLVDQDGCRGWRFCVSGCPYKKTYFNWNTFKAEKCTFCYPRIEAGLPTVCSETCVGRLRFIGVLLYDADRVKEAASVNDEKALYPSQLSVFLDPYDAEVIEAARAAGISDAWIDAAQRSPLYNLIIRWQVALPLHPEYRTLPMVWYIPPLSPMVSLIPHGDTVGPEEIFPTIDQMRIPVEYLANLLTAGDTSVIRKVLGKLWAMRVHMRSLKTDESVPERLYQEIGMTKEELERMARLLAVAKYQERYVIPTANRNADPDLVYEQGACSLESIAPIKGFIPSISFNDSK
ncbi:nitrate reductase subunit beta [Sulfobacillus harzensis]|uniref:Nitrate reductase subunit beta n=1 Tax=Sulfobacillus harzensis TaxID=2729629 RepID=A0A7Y0Q2J3_9FIRM|nr:nitrate reductase subunit beta [Sulfobacillus harzensis]NMP23253.1 nitrate reductase subunit beta [Sulfobacillus harzensis]